ncbi:hypothetical protein SLEP1_g23718 [Rubroshorea leprosula]|uniref:Transposase (putative) gypsy type domain-containing protein n=1 Tax=Rubroshorea leprosula TaxID=152421 RepID=A0AAV5JGB6_9ROSI|nr:hypothetical protein SLEP1_g23718 [Rubroshorea leprosula]
MTDGFNSLQQTSTMAELKGKAKIGELASLKACRQAGIHSHISVGLLRRQVETLQLEEQYAESTSHHFQDVPETMASESSTSSSASDNGGNHPSAPSSSSSSKGTPGREEGVGNVVSHVSDRPVMGEWESKTITGRLSNLRKAPKDLPTGFRFRPALHHEVADCAPSISGYRRLEEMVRAHHIPRTILLRTGAKSEKACTVSQTGWIPVYVDHFEAGLRFPLPGLVFDMLANYELALTQLTPNNIRFIIGFMLLCARLEVPAKAIVFKLLFQCRLCPNSRGVKWYYLSGRDKSQLFKNVRNKVARWKRQFIFVRDTRTERISNDLAALLSKWRVPNAHHLAVFGFVDVANLFIEGILSLDSTNSSRAESYAFFCVGEMSSILERQRQRAQGSRGCASGSAQPRQTRFDERPPPVPQSCCSSHRGSSSASRPRAEHRAEVAASSARRRAREETESEEDEVPLARRRISGGTQPAQAARPATVHSPNAPYVRAECQHAMVQGMHSFVPPVDSKRAKAFVQQHGGQVLTSVAIWQAFSYAVALYESEQGACIENNKLESQADGLTNRNNELREELERARVERESGIQAAKEEAARVAEADRNLTAAGEALNELKASHARSVSIARAQGAEWFLGSATFQDAVAVASANVTTEIYNEIRGKVLQHRPDFPIGELTFFDGEDLDEQGKSLAPLVDATVRLRWDLNEEGVPGAPVAEQEPSSTPPNSQPAVVPASSPVNAPAFEPATQSPSACSPVAVADASMPVDLTDD